jgi:hypothetical protein
MRNGRTHSRAAQSNWEAAVGKPCRLEALQLAFSARTVTRCWIHTCKICFLMYSCRALTICLGNRILMPRSTNVFRIRDSLMNHVKKIHVYRPYRSYNLEKSSLQFRVIRADFMWVIYKINSGVKFRTELQVFIAALHGVSLPNFLHLSPCYCSKIVMYKPAFAK